MFKVQYYTYQTLRVILRGVIGVTFVGLALVFNNIDMRLQSLLIMIGAWLLVSKDFKSKLSAEKSLQEREYELPQMNYEFLDKKFLVDGEGSMIVEYTKIKRLVEDKEYMYIFLGKTAIFMLNKEDINNNNNNNLENLKLSISEKSGLAWESLNSILFINFQRFKRAFSDLKEN